MYQRVHRSFDQKSGTRGIRPRNTPEEYVLNISLTQPVTEKPFQTTEETDIYEDHNESEVTSYNPNNESLIPNNDVIRNEAEEEPIYHINENQGVIDSTPNLLEKSSLPNNEVELTSENEIPSSSLIVTPNFENETIPPNQN